MNRIFARGLPGNAPLLIAVLTIAACGDRPESEAVDPDSHRSPLVVYRTGATTVRPSRDLGMSSFNCCSDPWAVAPVGRSHFDAINDPASAGCGDADYISAPKHAGVPYYSGELFEVDISTIPLNATVTDVTVNLCVARLSSSGIGSLRVSLYFWNTGEMFFGEDDTDITEFQPASSGFQTYFAKGHRSASHGASTTPKTATSKMQLELFGDDLKLARIYFVVNYRYPVQIGP
jgi:hypothetical protein